MRLLPCSALAAVLAACGADPVPRAVQPPPPRAADAAATAADPVTADPGLAPIVTRLLAGTASPADRERAAQHADQAVAELLAAAASSDFAAQGRAPGALLALGNAALPGLVQGLAHHDVQQRRIAVKTLLECSASLHGQAAAAPTVAALAAARDDQDPAVRAAAIHAWRRATGDTSALDQGRTTHEAAERAGR